MASKSTAVARRGLLYGWTLVATAVALFTRKRRSRRTRIPVYRL